MGKIYDGLVLALGVSIVVIGLCGRHFNRRCDHCGEVTYYIPRDSNEIVAAKESILDRVLDDWRDGGVYHWNCLPDHDFGGDFSCGS